jgi:glycosyltransferase involved in cell wall biosynthesis
LAEIPPLLIGVDARAASEVTAGRGRVARELLRALSAREDDGHRYLLFARERWQGDPLDERFRWHLIAAADPWWHLLSARVANRSCGVFLSSNSYLTSWFLRIPTVTIVYDLVTFEPGMQANRRSRIIERLTLAPAVRRSAKLLAISNSTAQALRLHFPAAAGHTVVAPLGVSPALAGEPEPGLQATLPPPGFVLAVGTLEPRKNLPRLVAAYSSLSGELRRAHPLVVVGALGWETGATLAALDSLGEHCIRLGHVSDHALAELYRRCAVFCYPSLGEGFGLPVLEAMAAGAPVVTSQISSLPEVGGDSVEYVDPYDVASIAEGLRRTLSDQARRADLREKGRERSKAFSWERFAEITLETLDRAASQPAPDPNRQTARGGERR